MCGAVSHALDATQNCHSLSQLLRHIVPRQKRQMLCFRPTPRRQRMHQNIPIRAILHRTLRLLVPLSKSTKLKWTAFRHNEQCVILAASHVSSGGGLTACMAKCGLERVVQMLRCWRE